jgi:hypothetical protein
MELWSRRDPVVLFGAIGMSESRWEQLNHTLGWVVRRFSAVSNFRIDVELLEVSGDLAHVLWFERSDGSIAGRVADLALPAPPTFTGARTVSGRSSPATPTTRAAICARRRKEDD